MKTGLLPLLFLVLALGGAHASDLRIPEKDIALMRTTDHIDVTGTNDLGGPEDFSIQDRKAIRQFIDLLTDDRYTAAPKSLQPKFKSLSIYQVRLSSNGAPVLELRVIADSILDLPGDPMFYLESDAYSANLMAPLLRLR